MIKNTSKRYMVYLDNDPKKFFLPSNSWTILSNARKLFNADQTVILRDLRIARNFLEFDVTIEEQLNIENIIEQLKTISPLKEFIKVEELTDYDKTDLIKKAIILFNEEKYWWAHEKLENVWKRSQNEEKKLLNGLILIAAAFVHFQKDEIEICLSILNRAYDKLKDFEGLYYGINLDRVNRIIHNDTILKKEVIQFEI